ncbi:hypothetical protein HMN09_01295500 [Mycena chlorophos]|uniref:Uncharacterized protein n=1 Tax=Mycena chlorophos TaxID=658473 RepID=A0A8H6RZ40_MYCCL|nr:hypothetical protein HMN09_01295500 [Mycena chlorophos]
MARTEYPIALAHGHVNMMADTVLVNASPEDLRAILRNMLASKTPGLVATFMTSTHARLRQKPGASEANIDLLLDTDTPSTDLVQALKRARMLFGSGLGFASLEPLTAVVRSTIGRHWAADGEVSRTLAMADADIAQAIQSCKDQLLDNGQLVDFGAARAAYTDLLRALQDSQLDSERWGGEFAFERGFYSVLAFKM